VLQVKSQLFAVEKGDGQDDTIKKGNTEC